MTESKEAVRRYVYRWDRQGRKGQECQLLARGTMNSVLLQFGDGYRMVTSGNALRRVRPLTGGRG